MNAKTFKRCIGLLAMVVVGVCFIIASGGGGGGGDSGNGTPTPSPTPSTSPTPTPTTTPSPTPSPTPEPFSISSTDIENGGIYPTAFTCDQNLGLSPQIQWSNPPAGTQSFVLILDDPDAPLITFVHWVVFNIPAATTSLDEGASVGSNIANLPVGALEGLNGFAIMGYGGPCPPPGPAHRYFFRLYALDTTLALAGGALRSQVDAAMAGRILAQTEMMATYSR